MIKHLQIFISLILLTFQFYSCKENESNFTLKLEYEKPISFAGDQVTKESIVFSPNSKSIFISENSLNKIELDSGLITNYKLTPEYSAITFSHKQNHLFLASIIRNPIITSTPSPIYTNRILLTEFDTKTGFFVRDFFIGKEITEKKYNKIFQDFYMNGIQAETNRIEIIGYGFTSGTLNLWTLANNSFFGSENLDFRKTDSFFNEKIVFSLYNVLEQKKVKEIILDDNVINLVISNDMKKIAYITMNRFYEIEYLVLYDLENNVELKRFHNDDMHFKNGVNSLSFSPDSKFIAIGCTDDKIRILDTSNEIGRIQSVLKNYSDVYSLCYSQDGNTLFTGNQSGKIVIYNVENKTEVYKFDTNFNEILKLGISSDNRYLFSINNDKEKHSYNIKIFSLFRE